MLVLLHAGHPEFRTGWLVESIATQTLVVYVIRTRRFPSFKSRSSLPMLLVPTGAAVVGAVLPYTGLANLLGFTRLPTTFFLLLFGMVVVYLVLVELAKTPFCRTHAPIRRAFHSPTRSGWSAASGAGPPGSSATLARSSRSCDVPGRSRIPGRPRGPTTDRKMSLRLPGRLIGAH
jgi:hypothetical protein